MAGRAQLITLTSDFGLHDPYVGIMKARIAQRAPAAHLIDLTHQITPFHPEEAGYWLHCCLPQFPAGTVHVAVVDPGVGSERGIVIVEAAGQVLIAPDNGLLGLIAAAPGSTGHRLTEAACGRLGLAPGSATFHGRDLMAPLGAEIVSGRIHAAALGPACVPQPGRLRLPQRDPAGVTIGQVAVVDRFGNALSTIPAEALETYRRPQVRIGSHRARLVRTYSDAQPDECVALINSSRHLELAVREGSAARTLNIEAGEAVYVEETAVSRAEGQQEPSGLNGR